ncbi:stage IV sporulation intramembrane metalloprotease SpoIVFB [Bacillus carboniphilus]|uniref:Stage IV sporulation intramembrane metalloprotease SpoIVFB n=1 Tax=Bacillus carboniphilus TaxID=86663 RepID=A0ABP3G3W1_9BACI
MNKWLLFFKKIHIHPLFWLVMGISMMTARFTEVIVLFTIVFLHELGHGLTAHFFSWRIKKISLLPFGGVAEMDEHGNRPLKEELFVVLAGPLQHVWIQAVLWGLYDNMLIHPDDYKLWASFNATILLINLLPAWPLDGGKLLFVGLSYFCTFRNAHLYTLYVTAVICTLSLITILLWNPYHLNSWVIWLFLLFSLWKEWKQRQYVFIRFLLERYYGKKKIEYRNVHSIQVNPEVPIQDVLDLFHRGRKHNIRVNGSDQSTTLDENELLHAFFADKLYKGKVGDLLYMY